RGGEGGVGAGGELPQQLPVGRRGVARRGREAADVPEDGAEGACRHGRSLLRGVCSIMPGRGWGGTNFIPPHKAETPARDGVRPSPALLADQRSTFTQLPAPALPAGSWPLTHGPARRWYSGGSRVLPRLPPVQPMTGLGWPRSRLRRSQRLAQLASAVVGCRRSRSQNSTRPWR